MQWAMNVMEALGYVGVILVMLIETVIPVIPSEVTLPFIGYLAYKGLMGPAGAIAAATIGCAIGAVILYFLSYYLGREALERLTARLTSHKNSGAEIAQAERWFQRYGGWAVFLCRMMPVMRCLISIPAGLTRMRLVPFISLTTVGALLWNIVLIGAGFMLGTAWERVGEYAHIFGYLFIGGSVAALAVYLLWKRSKGKRG